MVSRPKSFLLLCAILLLAGCGSERDMTKEQLEEMVGSKLKETVPVSGTVSIAGTPAGSVNILAYAKGSGMQSAVETRTAEDGTYCWATYQECDGMVPGEYQLAFTHVPKEGKGKKDGEDLLQGKYRNPTKNDFALVVESETPQTEVNYDLE